MHSCDNVLNTIVVGLTLASHGICLDDIIKYLLVVRGD